jgi:hypothetical protein
MGSAAAFIPPNGKVTTLAQYRTIVKRLDAFFGPMQLGAIRSSDVSRYVTKQLASPRGRVRLARPLHPPLDLQVGGGRRADRAEPGRRRPAPEVRLAERARLEAGPGAATRPLLRRRAGTGRVPDLRPDRRPPRGALRWRDVDLIENVVKVADSKTETGVRSIALTPGLHEELWQHRAARPSRARTSGSFATPRAGPSTATTRTRPHSTSVQFGRLDWPEEIRPCHDLRVTSITNEAIAGTDPIKLMTRAGHKSMATTNRYLKLAGVVFREEANALEERLLGASLSTASHTDLRELQPTSSDAGTLSETESALSDAG